MEQTILFLKPDGLHFQEIILQILHDNNLSYLLFDEIQFDETLIRSFYPCLSEEVIQKCIPYFSQQTLPIYIISGNNAVEKTKELKQKIRQLYGRGRTGEILHCTNHSNEFELEIELLKRKLVIQGINS